ncbi:sensor histidine kinase [Nitrosomonas communis]|uniref:sensor histidine kinase n=1 Tax=Nitrosomonas communis TaxID=44574 RepID=UPI00147AAF68|nr:histidine kinase dimerization/phospho-acceptor domain-containing protein [Nitrosomonas communis]
MASAIRNISDRTKIQKQLKQHVRELSRSNAELEQFVYDASDDLQEPLRIVGSFAQLLSQRYERKSDKDTNEFIGYIVDEANRMRILINDLLTFSGTSTSGKEFEPIDINEVVNMYCKICSSPLRKSMLK